MSDLAIYDMDRTVTRGPTYTPFLLHCAVHRARWRLIFVPIVLLSMIAYVVRLIDRATLKEINHHLLLGRTIHPRDLKPLVDSFADRQAATNIRPGARAAIARDKGEARRLVLATASIFGLGIASAIAVSAFVTLMLALGAIYFLVTQVLGIRLDVDPRIIVQRAQEYAAAASMRN